MAEVDKVSVGFDADIRDFNRGIDRMERKVQEFERKTDTEVAKVNKRFDLMGGTLDKVEKKMGGFGDNVDLKSVRENLEKAQNEFRETGKVSEEALNGLNSSIENVDFTKLDRGATRAMKVIQQDTEKLSTSLGKLEHFHLAKELPNEAKLLGNEFSKLEQAINDDKLALDQLKSKMKPKDFNDYRNSIDSVSNTMATFKSELKDTGRVSNDTFYKLKNDINSVNFNRLPSASQEAIAKVKNHVIDLGVEFDKMGTHVTRNEARMDRLRVKISNGMTTINERFQEGMRVFNVWGNRFRNIAEVGEHMFGGVLVPAITSLGPALATGTTGLMGFTNGLMSVGGAAAGLAGAFGMSLAAVKAFTGQATYALQMLEDGTLQATNETRRYQSSLEGLKSEWEGLIAQNQARIFNTMTNGINAARYALGQLNPFLTSTAGQIESLSSRVLNWVRTSKNAQNAFKVLNTVGVEAFGSMLRAAFSFLDGVTAVFVKLSPLYSWAAKGFENMAKSFREWANSAAATQEINAFIQFTKTNVPIVLNIFKNTFAGIFYLFKAFAGQTSWAMKGLEGMTEAFKNWAKELPKTEGFKAFLKFSRDNAPIVADLIKNLFNVIVELVKIMAPITVFTAKIASAVLGMAASFMKAHPAISRVIASFVIFFGLIKSAVFITSLISSFVQLRKVLTLLFGTQKAGILINKLFNKEVAKQKGAVGMAKSAITGLIGKIKELATSQMVTTAKTKIATAAQKAWQGVVNAGKATADAYRYAMARLATSKTIAAAKTKIATAATMAWTGVTKAASLAARGLGAAFRFMTGPVGIIITVIGTLIGVFVHLYKTNEDFRNFVNRCWNAIKNTAISVFGYLKNFFVNVWNSIKNISISTWNYLATALPNLWRNTVNGAKNIFRNLGAFFTNLWNGIKNITIRSWNGIKNTTSNLARGTVNVSKSVFRGLGAFFSNLWNGVKNVFIRSWQVIKNTTVNLARGTVNVLRSVFRGLGAFFTNLWNGVKNVSIRSWNAIKNGVVAIARGFINILRSVFRGLSTFFSGLWNGIKNISIRAWNGIKNGVMAVIRIWIAVVRAEMNIFKRIFTVVWNAIKTISVRVWNSIKNSVIAIVRLLVAGVRASLNTTKAIVAAVWNFVKRISISTWNAIKNGVLRIIRAMTNGIRALMNGLKTFIVAAWNFIKTRVVALARGLYNGVRVVFNALSNFTRKIFNSIKNFIVKTWNFIKTRVVAIARSMSKIVQSVFNALSNAIRKIFNAIKNFMIKTWNAIKSRVVAIGRSLSKILQATFRALSNAIKKIFNAVRNFMIKVWNSIKSRVVAIARSLSKVMQSIFRSLSNAIKHIFNAVKNFMIKVWNTIKNKVVSIVRTWSRILKSVFNALSKTARSIFNNLKNFLIKLWTTVKNKVVSIVKAMWRLLRSIFNTLSRITRNIFNNLKNFLVRLWTTIKNKVVSLARNMWNGVRRIFDTFSRVSRNIFNKLKRSITGTWRSLKNTMINFTRDMWNGVRRVFSNMTNGIKNFVGRIKSHLDDMVRGVKNGLNTLIEGVNWVGDKLGMGKQMIKPIKLSTGTGKASSYISNGKINRDTMAVVGDKGRGNGTGGFRHETITYPNGKQVITPDTDTLAYLPKGSTVHSGAQTQTAFSEGTLPKFSIGTAISNMLGGGKKPKKHKKDDSVVGDVMQKTKDGIKGMTGTVVEGGKAVVDGALNAAKKGKDWLSDKIGDVLDWIEKPKKLMDKVFEGFGLSMSSFGIPENAQIPFKLMTGMFKKLKEAAVNKVKEWFEESSAGDGGYIDLSKGINFGFAPTAAAARAQGYPFARPHYGLDINYKYDKVYSTLAGKATGSTGWNGGFGRNMWIRTKNGIEAIYGHLSKLAFHGTKQVKPGDYLGVSGGDPRRDGVNAGSSTGPHLHYEMRWNGQPKDPTNWLKKHNGGGGKGGTKKAASKWRGEIVRAAKQMKVHPTNAQINGIIAQIQRESGGDSGITQGNIGDINNLRGTPAQGLLQYVPSTFRSYAVKGHNNIKSGYDQLLAFFNNSNWANDIQYGRSGWGPRGHRRYERGGIVNLEQLAWIAEGGFSESIISHDPKYRARSKAIHDRTGEMLGFNEDTEILRNLERLLMLQNKHAQAIEGHTKRTADKNVNVYMDSKIVGRQVAEHVDTEIKKNEKRKAYFKGGNVNV